MADFEEEIFEISDFTVVTDWEKFTLQLETIIHEWQLNAVGIPTQLLKPLPKGCFENHHFVKKISDEVSFCGLNLVVHHCKLSESENAIHQSSTDSGKTTQKFSNLMLMQKHCPPLVRDLLDASNDFISSSDTHAIAKFYGLREFAVLYPVSWSDHVTSENTRNGLLSCIHMALSSSNCNVPFFLMVDESKRRLFSGVCQNTNVRTAFEMVHLKYAPPKGNHLAGILDIFKEKVACPLVTPPPVKVSVKVVYKLEEEFESQWSQAPTEFEDAVSSPSEFVSESLPLGTFQDPISDIRLCVKWPSVNEDMLVENDVYSDLDPSSAPFWALAVAFEPGIECILSEKLRQYCNLWKERAPVDEILGIKDRQKEAEVALGRLIEAPIPKVPSVGIRSVEKQLPLSRITVDGILDTIFASESKSKERKLSQENEESTGGEELRTPLLSTALNRADPFGSVTPGKLVSVRRRTSSYSTDTPLESEESLERLKESLLLAKVTPKGGLAWKLALSLSQVLSSVQGMVALSQLWLEVVQTLRDFWDRAETITGVPEEQPNMGACLLQQKLTMLQCCILAKRKIHTLKQSASQRIQKSDSESSLEFFDAQESTPDNSKEEIKTELSCLKPLGRLRQIEGSTLLNHPDDPLFEPVTQDPSPMTEDMLEEQVEMLSKLGSSTEGSAQRSIIQTDSLMSDMEAFKAANPKSCVEDFVRWHSPRDWVETTDSVTGEVKGQLSARMATPENLWKETWNWARPVPVTRQQRLFNESKEAEKILLWLSSLTVSDLCLLSLPCLTYAALIQLCTEARDVFPLIGNKLSTLCERFIAITRQPLDIDEYLDLLRMISWIELTVSQYRSIRSRLITASGSKPGMKIKESEIRSFVLSLMEKREVPILGALNSPLGQIVAEIFRSDARLRKQRGDEENRAHHDTGRVTPFPPSLLKEYVLRWFVPRPKQWSRSTPQRMHAFVHPGTEFRLSGAFTDDITFM